MDIMTTLMQIPGIGPLLPYIVVACVVAAAIATRLPPPAATSASFGAVLYSVFYGMVNLLALNVGHARNAGAPTDAPKPPAVPPAAFALFILAGLGLSGCLSPAQKAKVADLIQANQAAVTKFCDPVLAVANNPMTTVAAAAVPVVGQVQAAVKTGCGTAEGIANMAASASSVAWLATAKTVMETGGTVLPAPVAPVPIADMAVPPGS